MVAIDSGIAIFINGMAANSYTTASNLKLEPKPSAKIAKGRILFKPKSRRKFIMNILVGFNGSETSKKAIELSKRQAKAFNGVVTIFMSKPSHIDENASEKKAERFWTDLKNAETDIEHYREEFRKESLNCFVQISTREIDAGTDLLEYAKMIEADVIIIGIEKISKVGKFLFGSTAQKVILEANCPVLTVK